MEIVAMKDSCGSVILKEEALDSVLVNLDSLVTSLLVLVIVLGSVAVASDTSATSVRLACITVNFNLCILLNLN